MKELLGRGNFGSVSAIKRKRDGAKFAMKVISCESLDELSRSVQELSHACKMNSPHITKVYFHYMHEL